MRAASLITTQPFLWNNLSDASGKNWVRFGEWLFAELTKEFEQQVMQGLSVRENEKSSYDQRPCNCLSASVIRCVHSSSGGCSSTRVLPAEKHAGCYEPDCLP